MTPFISLERDDLLEQMFITLRHSSLLFHPATEHATTLSQLLRAVFILPGCQHGAVFGEADQPAQLLDLYIRTAQQIQLRARVARLD